MIKRGIFIGFVTGIGSNLIGLLFCVLIFSYLSYEGIYFFETIGAAFQNDAFGSLLVLGALPNFLPFFCFLKYNKPYFARGVLLASIVAALVVAFMKLV